MDFSKIEIEIGQAISEGDSNKEIARFRCRSLDTIKAHVKNMMAKSQTKNRAHLVKILMQQRLIKCLFFLMMFFQLPMIQRDENDSRRLQVARSFSRSPRGRFKEDLL